jgi:hypothetical protein
MYSSKRLGEEEIFSDTFSFPSDPVDSEIEVDEEAEDESNVLEATHSDTEEPGPQFQGCLVREIL